MYIKIPAGVHELIVNMKRLFGIQGRNVHPASQKVVEASAFVSARDAFDISNMSSFFSFVCAQQLDVHCCEFEAEELVRWTAAWRFET